MNKASNRYKKSENAKKENFEGENQRKVSDKIRSTTRHTEKAEKAKKEDRGGKDRRIGYKH